MLRYKYVDFIIKHVNKLDLAQLFPRKRKRKKEQTSDRVREGDIQRQTDILTETADRVGRSQTED